MDLREVERLRGIKSFPSLVKYLRDELGWPVESEDFEELTYDYEPEELGLDAKTAVKVHSIKQLRPLVNGQPFGIFFISFAPKRLPVVVLRRILGALALKKRTAADHAHQAAWRMHDLLFISSHGEDQDRAITFAHFREDECQPGDAPTLRVLCWDGDDTVLHLGHAHETLRRKLQWPAGGGDPDAWRRNWSDAFTTGHREVITTSRALALRLAILARGIRRRVNAVLAVESDKGPVRRLHAAFREALIHDLGGDDFADTYAQTVAYGLLTARVSRPAGLVADNLVDMVPVSNPFLHEMLQAFLHIGGKKQKGGAALNFDELGVTEVVETLRHANMEAVLRDFGDRNPLEDPVIHFYELFLREYDAGKRMQRGVFYTPKPVVSFIVRSVHELLRREFGLEDGLADTTTWGEMVKRHPGMALPMAGQAKPGSADPAEAPVSPDTPFVQILDPATGTGTFLVEVVQVIHETMTRKWERMGRLPLTEIPDLWNEYVPKHLLPRLHGYELMMAPYAIAHMKLSLKLQETGYRFGDNGRVRVFLTNALEPPQDFSGRLAFDVPALAHEAAAVNAIKRGRQFTVVIGNPPYAGESSNKGDWITGLMRGTDTETRRAVENYFAVDAAALGEANPKWLNDDYVKFMRLAHSRIELCGCGILAFITNHGYLDNPTFRGMRESLMGTFDLLHLLDLHGNLKKREQAPDGSRDENVFDIEQGVAVGLFLRRGEKRAPGDAPRVFQADLRGLRDGKYATLKDAGLDGIPWAPLAPQAPFRLFIPYAANDADAYNTWPSVRDIFPVNSVGIVTARDALAIHWSRGDLRQTLDTFSTLDTEAARELYELGKDARDWRVEWAQREVREHASTIEDHIFPITYRPFDTRWTFFTGTSRGFLCMPRGEVMRHMIAGENMGLMTTRMTKDKWDIHCSDSMIAHKALSAYDITYLFPLFLNCTRNVSDEDLEVRAVREEFGQYGNGNRANLSHEYILQVSQRIQSVFATTASSGSSAYFTPEEVFHYLYAVLHSPEYRARYAAQLRLDFARVPLPGSAALFHDLCGPGRELTNLHLLREVPESGVVFPVCGGGVVEKPRHDAALERVYINKTQYFGGISESVWNFHIGGYQVCEKWLKDRKGRVLSGEETEHYRRIAAAISGTIRVMGEIDGMITRHGGWPAAFAPAAGEG